MRFPFVRRGEPEDPVAERGELDVKVFEPAKPLLRRPAIVNGKECLAFPNEKERQKALKDCKQEVEKRCMQRASAKCSVRAMDRCRGPRFMRWFGLGKDPKSVEACEQKFMEGCTGDAKSACRNHAGNFCENSMPMTWCE